MIALKVCSIFLPRMRLQNVDDPNEVQQSLPASVPCRDASSHSLVDVNVALLKRASLDLSIERTEVEFVTPVTAAAV